MRTERKIRRMAKCQTIAGLWLCTKMKLENLIWLRKTDVLIYYSVLLITYYRCISREVYLRTVANLNVYPNANENENAKSKCEMLCTTCFGWERPGYHGTDAMNYCLFYQNLSRVGHEGSVWVREEDREKWSFANRSESENKRVMKPIIKMRNKGTWRTT